MTDQIVDQRLVFADPLGAAPVGHASRLHDRRVVAHVVDDTYKPVFVQHRDWLVQYLFQLWHCHAVGCLGLASLGHDLVPLFWSEPHRTAHLPVLTKNRKTVSQIIRLVSQNIDC